MSGDYRVVVTTRLGGARMLYRTRDGFSYRRGKTGHAYMTAPQVEAAKKWARKRLARKVRVVAKHQDPFILYRPGVTPPTNKNLLRALNATGRQRRRFIECRSGMRTPRKAWELRMLYLRGDGNTAAPCCTRYEGQHSWENCGKNPLSNHASGDAADCGTVTAGGKYRSLADDKKARKIFEKLGGCFPVRSPQWEPWHAELCK